MNTHPRITAITPQRNACPPQQFAEWIAPTVQPPCCGEHAFHQPAGIATPAHPTPWWGPIQTFPPCWCDVSWNDRGCHQNSSIARRTAIRFSRRQAESRCKCLPFPDHHHFTNTLNHVGRYPLTHGNWKLPFTADKVVLYRGYCPGRTGIRAAGMRRALHSRG